MIFSTACVRKQIYALSLNKFCWNERLIGFSILKTCSKVRVYRPRWKKPKLICDRLFCCSLPLWVPFSTFFVNVVSRKSWKNIVCLVFDFGSIFSIKGVFESESYRQRTFLDVCVRRIIHLSNSFPLRIVTVLTFRYGRKESVAHSIAKEFLLDSAVYTRLLRHSQWSRPTTCRFLVLASLLSQKHTSDFCYEKISILRVINSSVKYRQWDAKVSRIKVTCNNVIRELEIWLL